MDRTEASDAFNAGSIPVECIFLFMLRILRAQRVGKRHFVLDGSELSHPSGGEILWFVHTERIAIDETEVGTVKKSVDGT